MSFAGDVLGFEKFNLGNTWRKIKENPWRALVGSTTGAGTKLWNKVLNRDDEPLVDDWGGAPKDSYQKAEAAGINTGPGSKMHQVARLISAYYAGSYGADKAGWTGSAGSGGSGGEIGGELSGGGSIPSTPTTPPPTTTPPWSPGPVEGGLGSGTYTGGALEGSGGSLGSGTYGGAETFSSSGGGGGGAPLWQRMMRAGLQNMQNSGGQSQQNQGLQANEELLRRRQEEEQRRQEEERRRLIDQALLESQIAAQGQQPQRFM